MDERLLYRLYAAQLYEVMPAVMRRMLEEYGSAEAIWNLNEKELTDCVRLNDVQREEFLSAKKRGLPVEMPERMKKSGMTGICYEDPDYPARLRELPDAPYMLFCLGKLPEEDRKSVAVIGTRHCSDYGRRTAEYFGRELAVAGVPVISGMAAGIDSIAQKACVDHGGESYGILGCGVDVIYPSSNRELYRKLTEQGGVISEYLPGSDPLPYRFPLRNRLISAFCDLLIVVEAREKSGSHITVQYALEQGKDVYAVPGRVGDSLSTGCNRLLSQGAGVAWCVEEVLLALKDMHQKKLLTFPLKEIGESIGIKNHKKWPGKLQGKLQKLLNDAPGTAQELYVRLGDPEMKIQELLTVLMQLEIEGKVLCRGGRYEIG